MKALPVLASVMLTVATPCAAQELVTNGGFESGNFSSFTLSGNGAFTGVDTGSASTGTYGAFFGSVGSVGNLSQTIATTAGSSYLISFDLRNGGAGSNFFQAIFGGMQLFSATNASIFGFTHYSATATASGASTALTFSFQNDPDYFRLDNVSVISLTRAVPEPATWMLLLLGFGAIGVSFRRRTSATRAA